MKRMSYVLGVAIVSAVTLLGMALPAGAQSRATWIGAVGVDSLPGWQQTNQDIGPLQTAREYYADALPSSWSDATNFCKSLPSIVCVISYHTKETKSEISGFVKGIPAHRAAPVFISYYDEPEAHIASGKKFVSEYENQVDEVRAACAAAGNCGVVKVAMIASTYTYQAGKAGYNCSYIPPAKYVDVYFADVYEPVLIGLKNDPGFQRWNYCTAGRGVDRGLTEYGLGACVTSGTWTEQVREDQLAADAKYLSSYFPHLYMWEYYWHVGTSAGGCKEFKFPAHSVTATEWQAIEQGAVAS